MLSVYLREFLQKALQEDIGTGDITSEACVDPSQYCMAVVVAKEDMVVAGLPVLREVFRLYDPEVRFSSPVREGQQITVGQSIATVEGRTRSVLAVERVGLNILQRLSGIATLTRRYVQQVEGTGVQILDTRKTVPTLRMLEKYAVRIGGGKNHRFGLYDGILIKDNHIRAAGGIRAAVERVRSYGSRMLKIEVEVEDLQQAREAAEAGVDVIMLDNMATEEIKSAVELIRSVSAGTKIEVSGGVNLQNVKEIAQCGVDYISIGAITHSARAVDISLEIVKTFEKGESAWK